MLLASAEADTPDIRAALLEAAQGENDVVRAEALLGLARQGRDLAPSLAIAALSGERTTMAVFEAAELIADPALVELLRPWVRPSDNEWLDSLARDALSACEAGNRIN